MRALFPAPPVLRARIAGAPAFAAAFLLFLAQAGPSLAMGRVPRGAQPAASVGVLVMAHGGSERWNGAVESTVEAARLRYPVEIAFGMGMHGGEVEDLQRAVIALEARGVSRIVAVPVLVSSASEVMRQYAYLLGLAEHGPWEDHAKPVRLRVPVSLTEPLNDDPVVAQILAERAKAVSRDPAGEAVVVIAHGPNTDEDNAFWLDAMRRVTESVRASGGYRAVIPATMRDDAPKPVLDAAIESMRGVIEREALRGKVIVVPLMIANGGVDEKIPPRLQGLDFVYQPQALLPHPGIAAWIAKRVEQEAASGGNAVEMAAPSGPGTVAAPGAL